MTDTEEWAQARDRDILREMRDEQRMSGGIFEYPAEVILSRNNRPVVALDIDGTLGDYHAHFLWFAERYFGRPFPPPTEVNPGLRLSTFMGIPHREYRDCKLAYRQGGLKRFMPAYPYASELTENIHETGADVWICTSRPYLRLDNIDPDTRGLASGTRSTVTRLIGRAFRTATLGAANSTTSLEQVGMRPYRHRRRLTSRSRRPTRSN